jgi:predicted deacylase
MKKSRKRLSVGNWFGERIEPGTIRDVMLPVGESYSSMTVEIPIQIRRAVEPGPTVFITAALHGDELNGTGTIQSLIQDDTFKLVKGSVMLVPVLNILGFERYDRYLPDRRDLNRYFPGNTRGSLASRMARILFDQIVSRCDYGIDLHTAAVRRTNFPNVRADLSRPEARKLAEMFGLEIIMDGKGPVGSLRREACKAGCPTIIMEGGEVWKIEPGIAASGAEGVKNVLKGLGMLEGEKVAPAFQLVVDKSTWIRAERGGMIRFHVSPGDLVEKGQALVTNTTILGSEQNIQYAPFNGIVIGMTSLPVTAPGEAICNLGKLPVGMTPRDLEQKRESLDGVSQQVSEELASSISVVEYER